MLLLYGKVPRYSPATEQRGRHRGRRFGDLCCVLYADPEVGGMTGGRISGKGKNPRDNAGALHILALEGRGGDCTCGKGTDTAVKSVRDAHTSG